MTEWSIRKYYEYDPELCHKHKDYHILLNTLNVCSLCKEKPPNHILIQWELLDTKNLPINSNIAIVLNNTQIKSYYMYDIKHNILELITFSNDKKESENLKQGIAEVKKLLEEYGLPVTVEE